MKIEHPLVSFAIVLVAIGSMAIIFSKDSNSKNLFENEAYVKLPPVESATPSGISVADIIANPGEPPEDHVEYRNEKYGFSYYHSPESTITEYDEGGGAMTVVQENLGKARGLQIFIIPYDGEVITEERFRRDVPSGVRYNVESTKVGVLKVPAVTFYSYHELLGETRELWFIRDGYLYEITTFKGFGDWFSHIMQTWRFI